MRELCYGEVALIYRSVEGYSLNFEFSKTENIAPFHVTLGVHGTFEVLPIF